MSDKQVVLAIYDEPHHVRSVVGRLRELGLGDDRMSVVSTTGDRSGSADHVVRRGGAAGAVGGSMGGVLTALGLAALPGAGWILAIGPLATVLTTAAAGGGLGAGFGALLARAGFDKEPSERLAEAMEEGAVLISVDPPAGKEARVREAMIVSASSTGAEAAAEGSLELVDPHGRTTDSPRFGRPDTLTISG